MNRKFSKNFTKTFLLCNVYTIYHFLQTIMLIITSSKIQGTKEVGLAQKLSMTIALNNILYFLLKLLLFYI